MEYDFTALKWKFKIKHRNALERTCFWQYCFLQYLQFSSGSAFWLCAKTAVSFTLSQMPCSFEKRSSQVVLESSKFKSKHCLVPSWGRDFYVFKTWFIFLAAWLISYLVYLFRLLFIHIFQFCSFFILYMVCICNIDD